MIKVLANDGIHPSGQKMLEGAGFTVVTDKIPQSELKEGLAHYQILLVRSATKVGEELMRANPQLKLIGRAGVGLDNIDLKAAEECKIKVINTPAASSRSVAELAVSHMLSLSRFLHVSNREMPTKGKDEFKALKKSYSKGVELQGKTLGIIGMGRIGTELAKIAVGLGMNIMAVDLKLDKVEVQLDLGSDATQSVRFDLNTVSKEAMLSKADYISIHIPSADQPILGSKEFEMMKKGAFIINTARGGVVDELALVEAIDKGLVAGAGLDVFEGEPKPVDSVLQHPKISLSPHTGASTVEAQERIGLELAEQIIAFYS